MKAKRIKKRRAKEEMEKAISKSKCKKQMQRSRQHKSVYVAKKLNRKVRKGFRQTQDNNTKVRKEKIAD